MTHYQTLGVDETATPEQIKRAYRKKATETHPDKGGDQTEFAQAANAYETLKDPVRRQLYDATGLDREIPIEQEVEKILMHLLNQAISAENDIPIIKTVRDGLENGLSGRLPEMIKNLEKRREKLLAKREKVTTPDGTENFVHRLIDQQLKGIDQSRISIEREIKVGEACLLALDAYEEDWNEPKPVYNPLNELLATQERQMRDMFRGQFNLNPNI